MSEDLKFLMSMLKDSGYRQMFTDNLAGGNVYWDGECWRLAGNPKAQGVKATEECVAEILGDLINRATGA